MLIPLVGKLFEQYLSNKASMRFLITLFLSLAYVYCYSQEFETKRESLQLIESRSVYLNGGLRASMGGKSRTSIKVDLPPNTVKWYYSFTTSKGKSGVKNLELAIQLSGFLADPSGISTELLSNISASLGRTQERLRRLTLLSSQQRVIHFIAIHVKKAGRQVGYEYVLKPPLTHQEIGNIAGVGRQTVTTIMNELRRDNIIHFTRQYLIVRDMDKLFELSGMKY